MIASAELRYLPPLEIRFCSGGYHRQIDQTALQEFAAEILVHRILSPLLVRKSAQAEFELVAGERRLRLR
ncbi:ParB N-terminal domain-containing protein [Dyadobacter sp. SG02]|uniref:ParB N-terminal domain-containing protein n=1 Tax=Dyadobacter sp. SG02 TaxID=1855291 RepID=UPI000B86B0B3